MLGAGERVPIIGWSESPVSATVWSPSAGASAVDVVFDATTGVWEIAVDVGDSAWTRLTLHPS